MFFSIGNAQASILTFDDAIFGATSYSFDSDGDLIDDVVFSTTDPGGFRTAGPGAFMSHIDEPGLEGSTHFDLRVDFLIGAIDYLTFGFALDDFSETSDTWASFSVYDSSDTLLASDFEMGLYTLPDGINQSNFPEGIIDVTFAGTAAYALFDFNNHVTGGQRYIIDNFEGTFGSTEIPEPLSLSLLAIGLLGLGFLTKRA